MKVKFWQNLPAWILRLHGVALVLLAMANTGVSYGSTLAESSGPFRFLFANPAAEIGLWQAYLLMSLIGLVLFFGASGRGLWRLDLLGIVAHLVPLSALWLFKPLVVAAMGEKTFFLSLTIHTVFILLECCALLAGWFAWRKAGVRV